MRLQNKVAIVTGAATGIGRAIALRLAADGAAVTVDYIGPSDNADQVVRQIIDNGGKAIAVQADVSQPDQVAALVEQTVAEFGQLDVLVNNAAKGESSSFLDAPLELWQSVIAVSLTGPWLCSQQAARQMVRQGQGGRIINISSVHEDLPMPTQAAYCVAKGGLRMMMRTIAVELAPHKITVNNIGPGAIDSQRNTPARQNPDLLQQLLAIIPLARLGQPDEVADLAVYLASDAAAYVTGSTFFIDGGMLRYATSL